jgi:hypothetical protein
MISDYLNHWEESIFVFKVTLAAIWIPQIDSESNWIIAPTHPEMYSAICLRNNRFDIF